MGVSMKDVDPAFQGVGLKAGMEIWRIETFRPVLLPRREHGKFYSGDSYIVLRASTLKSGALHFDVHFWLGKDTSQDEAGVAAMKTVELDAALGGRAVEYREVEGQETDLFLSYFKPCVIPLEGGVSSGFKIVELEEYKPCLFLCKGRRRVRVKQVPFARSSLNHTDVFILDTSSKLFQFNGQSSTIQERVKALEVVQYIKDTNHDGKCEVVIIDDGMLGVEEDTGQFWVLFGGFAPLPRKRDAEDDDVVEATTMKLQCISAGHEKEIQATALTRELLTTDKCYLLDCGAEVYVWTGRNTSLNDRKAASVQAERLVTSQKRRGYTQITRVMEGFETPMFRSNFDNWPLSATRSVSEDGRGKIAVLLKQQGVNVNGIRGGIVADDPLLLDSTGNLEIWQVINASKIPVPPEEFGKFYSGHCYIVVYTFPGPDRKNNVVIWLWFGQHSLLTIQRTAANFCSEISSRLKGSVQGRVHQGKEPAYFSALFRSMIVLEASSSADTSIPNSEVGEDRVTSTDHRITLLRVQQTGPWSTQAMQVDAVAASLNSGECFVLATDAMLFLWYGSSTSPAEQKMAIQVAEKFKPGCPVKALKEGVESTPFWNALGGKRGYASTPKLKGAEKDTRMFGCVHGKGERFKEVFNFDQDDLLSDDIVILDTSLEVFVWVGQQCTRQRKSYALSLGQAYINHAAATEGSSPLMSLYQVLQGYEPPFFTRWFSWDTAKAIPLSDLYEQKIAITQGRFLKQDAEGLNRRVPGYTVSPPRVLDPTSDSDSTGSDDSAVLKTQAEIEDNVLKTKVEGGSTQRAAAMAALSSVWNSPVAGDVSSSASSRSVKHSPGAEPSGRTVSRLDNAIVRPASQRAAALAALSSVLETSPNSRPHKAPEGNWVALSSPNQKVQVLDQSDISPSCETVVCEEFEEIVNEDAPDNVFPFSRLKIGSLYPVDSIDATRRESYLSSVEFEKLFGMDKQEFAQLPKWKQMALKKKLDLF